MSEFIEVGGRVTGPKLTEICTNTGQSYFAPCTIPSLVYGQKVVLENKDASTGNQVYYAKSLTIYEGTHWVVVDIKKPSSQELGSSLTFIGIFTGIKIFQPSELLMEVDLKPVTNQVANKDIVFKEVDDKAKSRKFMKNYLSDFDVVSILLDDGTTEICVFNRKSNSLSSLDDTKSYFYNLCSFKDDLTSINTVEPYHVDKVCKVSNINKLIQIIQKGEIVWDYIKPSPVKMTLEEVKLALGLDDLEIVE